MSGPPSPIRDNRLNSRLVLVVGFGGLLVLLGYAGYGGLQALQQIQKTNNTVRSEFLRRTRVLERIRADLYVSGTYVRDFLLEQESGKAEGHRYSLLESRSDMDAALREYSGLLTPREKAPFQALTANIAAYWKVLDPVFQWQPEQRRRHGYLFLRDEVFPRRMAMLGIANQIGAINESQWNEGRAEVERTFGGLRRHLLVALGLTIGLGFLLAGFSVRTILTLDTEAAERYSEIAKAGQELQALSARLVQVQEEERKSISRELHDEVGQALTGVLVEMANLSTLIRAQDFNAAADKAEETKKLLENSISVVRNMALLLRPSMLDDLGLIPALQWQAREVSRRTGMRVKVLGDGVSEELPDEHKTSVYRIVQEALNNGVRHAQARSIQVNVRQEDRQLCLSIEDDGKGFNAETERGMGLVGIGERVSRLGGSFAIESQPSHGTVLRVSLPLPKSEEPA